MKKLTAIALSLFMAISLTPIYAEENVGWQKEAGTYYYYENGQKKTGWFKEQNCWYYFNPTTGAMKTGWVADNEYWYFLGESGVMQTNTWIESNGNRYFIQGNGIMAADTVKDGYELDSDGKAIPLSESKSELYDPNIDYDGIVIEGNLYINAENKEVELKNVTIKNKLVIYGEKQAEIKINLIDSSINTISFQQKNIEITLSSKTTVKNVLFEEGGSIKKDKDYKGSIENIIIRSAVIQSVEIDVSSKNIEVNNYAGCIIKSKADELIINRKSEVQFKARVKNVIVSEKAKDSILTISRASTITELTGNASFKADGEGTVNTLFANEEGIEFGEDLYLLKVIEGKGINDAPKVHKRPVYSSSTNNDIPNETHIISTEEDFYQALEDWDNITIPKEAEITLGTGLSSSFSILNKVITVEGTFNLSDILFTLNNSTLKINGGTINLDDISSISLGDSSSKIILNENGSEHTLQGTFANDSSYLHLNKNSLNIKGNITFNDMNRLTKFKSLFKNISFENYPNDIHLTDLQDMRVTLTNVSGKVELKGSEESPTVTFLNANNAVFREAESFSVYYTDLGTIDHVEVKKNTVLLYGIDAKITGINEVELRVAEGISGINVSKSDFYPTADSPEKIDLIFNGDIFKWDSTSKRWIIIK